MENKEVNNKKEVKNQLKVKNFYLPIIESLRTSTNLIKLQEKLSISKQQLNYYLRELKRKGIIEQKGRGWYEVVKEVKDSTKYGSLLKKDMVRGHAYICNIKIPKIEDWDKRIEILTKKGVHFKLVGAKLDTPRIKVLGRKVWLCKDHLRVFDKKEMSYYGETAKESKSKALSEIKLIVGVLERKLGILIKPEQITIQKEHYALIKNDLAIEENKRGNIWRISDEFGEWLLIDDSLEQGGELENVGKKAYQTNIPMQKWWNNHKETNFQVTPTFLLESINKIAIIQKREVSKSEEYAEELVSHKEAIKLNAIQVEKIAEGLNKFNELLEKLNEKLDKR